MTALFACGSPSELERLGIVRDGRTGTPVVGARVRAGERTATTDDDGRFSIRTPSGASLIATAPGKCGSAQEAAAEGPITLHLFDSVEVEEQQTQVGFGVVVRLEVKVRCNRGARLRWRQVWGPEVELDVSDGGKVVEFRTHRIDELVRLSDQVGVVAFDRTQRGDYRFEVQGSVGGVNERRDVRVVAGPTAAGIFQVPTGADLYLNGGDSGPHEWVLENRPDESIADLVEAEFATSEGRLTRLRPDRFGTYLVAHSPSGTRMTIQAGAYVDVPRDCGREGCHRSEDQGWATTAHSRTFRRGIEGELGEDFDEACWSCHATGVEHGVNNGGLHQTASRFAWKQPEPGSVEWDDVPRRIRRRGSVWCSACHGPGRIVPPQFHWQYGAKYQVGVCARCHDVDEADPDANHRSAQVDQWHQSPMSQLSSPDVLEPECSRCHTAQGFVAYLDRAESIRVDDIVAAPVTCATCHDPHDGSRPRGLRRVGEVQVGNQTVNLGRGAICAQCHQNTESTLHSPQANLLLGHGAESIAAMSTGPHRELANGCITCHMAEAPGDAQGGHTFRAPSTVCSSCHPGSESGEPAAEAPASTGIRRRVQLLRSRLDDMQRRLALRIRALGISDRCPTPTRAERVEAYQHELILAGADRRLGDCNQDGEFAEGERSVGLDRLPRGVARAARDLHLWEADGSRGVHNPAYALALFTALERVLPPIPDPLRTLDDPQR